MRNSRRRVFERRQRRRAHRERGFANDRSDSPCERIAGSANTDTRSDGVAEFATDIDAELAADVDAELATNVDRELPTNINAEFATDGYAELATNVDADFATDIDADFTADVDADSASDVDTNVSTDVRADVNAVADACYQCNAVNVCIHRRESNRYRLRFANEFDGPVRRDIR